MSSRNTLHQFQPSPLEFMNFWRHFLTSTKAGQWYAHTSVKNVLLEVDRSHDPGLEHQPCMTKDLASNPGIPRSDYETVLPEILKNNCQKGQCKQLPKWTQYNIAFYMPFWWLGAFGNICKLAE